MLDFTSALYLGLQHRSASLQPWRALTLGRPAGLQEPPGAAAVAMDLARLQGCEAGVLVPSTLHLFWDLFQILSEDDVVILTDAGTYPIARWGVERAAALGIQADIFPHHDAAAAEQLARRCVQSGRRPVIVADGYSPGTGRAAPPAYAEIARHFEGYLVLDDTQALGILGDSPCPSAPYGTGGGGSLRQHCIAGPHLLVGASLAKGFGVPVAVLAASPAMVRRFKECSQTRIHTSPPSVAVINAAQHALDVNRHCGERLRSHVWRLVQRLRKGLARLGLAPVGGSFPVQTLEPTPWLDILKLHEHLRQMDIETVLHKGRNEKRERMSVLLTAKHTSQEVDHLLEAIAQSLKKQHGAKVSRKYNLMEAL